MRIAFMGTPEFAVPILTALVRAKEHEVVGVFTQPDRPAGRGKKLMPPPVKVLAQQEGIPVYQFERIRKQEGIDALRKVAPDIVVTAAFGQILSQVLLRVPPMGTVNVHASLLPAYRGPAPINWCIINGESEAGVTSMYTDVGIDTGDMIYAQSTPIGPDETAGELTRRLSQMGAELIVRTLRDIGLGTAPRIAQDAAKASHQPMLSKEMGRIDWSQKAQEIDQRVRGMSPWPSAYTQGNGETFKIWKVRPAPGNGRAGEVLLASAKEGLLVACRGGAVQIVELQPPGKGRMSAKDYLRGHTLSVGVILGGEHAGV